MRRLLLAALLSVTAINAASAQESATSRDGCFFSGNWDGWSAPGNGNVLYLHVRPNNIYRLELAPGTRVHKTSDRFLVNDSHSGPWVCSALDLNLRLRDPQGFSQPLIGRTLTRLTADEAAAIPAHDLPN